MSASEGDGDEVSTGISLLASVDEQSLRSARADIEDALGDPISVDVAVESPGTVTPDIESPVAEDIGAPDPPDPPDPPAGTQSDALTPDAILPAREESVGPGSAGVPDTLPEEIARAQAEQGLAPNRERRFARREHRWARQRTEDQEDLLTAVRDIEDSLNENFTDGGGLLGGLFGGVGDILGDFGGAAALTGAAAALTGAAKALVGAAVALGGGAVLDTVTDTLFGGGGDDSESVELDEDELQSLSQIEGVDSTLTELVQLQQQTVTAINSIDSGGGGGDGPFGFNPPDFEFPDPPDFLTNPPEFPDLPDFLGGGNGGGQDVTVTVAPNPLPVEPSPVGLTPTPVPVAETTLPVASPTLPVETPTLSTETPVLSVATPTLEVETPTLPVETPGAVPLTPVPVPATIALPGGGGEGGGILPGPIGDFVSGGVDFITGGGILGELTGVGGTDSIGDIVDNPFGGGPLLGGGGGDGVGGDNSGALGRLIERQEQSENSQPVVVDSDVTTTVNLGDITAEVTANFDRLKQDLLTEVTSALDQQEREFEQEIDRIERELENETRDIRREIDRGLRTN